MSERKWKNRDALVTAFDNYEEELEKTIIQRNKFMKRAISKPMARVEESRAPHIENRGNHMFQTAPEAKKLARGLGLNETVAKIGMLMHDAGHPFGAHEGEQTMNIIGELLNTGYFHHNAKGIDVILSENLIEKFIDDIPEARDNQELRKKMKNDVWYFFDLIVGHDGESSKKDEEEMRKTHKKYKSVKEAVLDKARKANRTNNYKCQVETLEAQLSKPADILSYLKSDMLDAFSQGIVKEFSDDYLVLISKLLLENNEQTKELDEQLELADDSTKEKIRSERIKRAKKYINELKKQELRETTEDIDINYDRKILGTVDKILKEIEEKGLSTFSIEEQDEETLDKITNKAIQSFIEEELKKGTDKQTIGSDKNKIIDYTKKMIQIRKRTVEKVMAKIQEALEQDYISTTLAKWNEIEKDVTLTDDERYKRKKATMGFSDKASHIIYGPKGMKQLNYIEYVQYTKREYQRKSLPQATLKMIEQCANSLVKTGIIRDKFYDRTILKHIHDEEVKSAMKVPERDEESYTKYKLKIGIREPGSLKLAKQRREKYSKKREEDEKKAKRRKEAKTKAGIFKEIYNYTQRQGARFALSCEDVYYAIPYTVRSMVKKAVDSKYKPNDYLPEEEKSKVYKIRRELAERFGEYGGIAITKENLEKYINELIKKERDNLELSVAREISIKYLGGMTDKGIVKLLIDSGNLSKETYEKEDVPDRPNENIIRLSRTLSESAEPEEKSEEFKKRIKETHRVKPLMVINNETNTEKEL